MRIFSLFFILILTACSFTENDAFEDSNSAKDTPPIQNETDVASDYAEAFESANALQLFFKEDKSVATFIGEGNEYASFVETTEWLDRHTVLRVVDNGGATIYRLYTISDEAISLVYEDISPPEAGASSYPVMEEVMRLPIEVGTSFGDWTITEMNVTMETPLKIFTGVVEVSNESADTISRRYYAPSFGLIMQIDEMQVEDDVYVVRSTLEVITYK